MPSEPIWIPEGSASASSAPVATIKRPSADKATTTTADPGTSGTTLAVTANALFPGVNGFQVQVVGTSGVREIMLVTGGAGTNSWTVTRGQEGTTGVAHSVGATVSLMEAVQVVTNQDANKVVTFKGRASGFRTPGRAGTTGQKVLALHNATGSLVLVDVQKILLDFITTVAIGKVGTIIPPIVRMWKFTAVPTNGTALTKQAEDTAGGASSSAVTVWGDASADGTGSATALTVTLPAGTFMSQMTAPNRVFGTTGSGTNPWMEDAGRMVFFPDSDEFITLRALEGICVFLDYTVATANPTTDFWIPSIRWTEYRIA